MVNFLGIAVQFASLTQSVELSAFVNQTATANNVILQYNNIPENGV